jgi:hypothetical protein
MRYCCCIAILLLVGAWFEDWLLLNDWLLLDDCRLFE